MATTPSSFNSHSFNSRSFNSRSFNSRSFNSRSFNSRNDCRNQSFVSSVPTTPPTSRPTEPPPLGSVQAPPEQAEPPRPGRARDMEDEESELAALVEFLRLQLPVNTQLADFSSCVMHPSLLSAQPSIGRSRSHSSLSSYSPPPSYTPTSLPSSSRYNRSWSESHYYSLAASSDVASSPPTPRGHNRMCSALSSPMPPRVDATFTPTINLPAITTSSIRVFQARLRVGMLVLKYPTSRFSSPSPRLLFTRDNGATICYQSLNPEGAGGGKKVHSYAIEDLLEIRHGWTVDPLVGNLSGTRTLRRKCPARDALRSFSLIFATRTVDFTAASYDQCVILMRGMNGLAIKAQADNPIAEVMFGAKEDEEEKESESETRAVAP